MYEVARRATPEDLKHIRPQFIGINSELSTQDQRNFISETFHCPVYDEYSTEETWMIASQCRQHNYHIFTDNVWVEFIDSRGREVQPGEMGEIVLTTTLPICRLSATASVTWEDTETPRAPVASDSRCWRPSRAGPTIASFCRAGNSFLR